MGAEGSQDKVLVGDKDGWIVVTFLWGVLVEEWR